MIRSLFKNASLPKQASHCGDDIRKARLSFDIPLCTANFDTMTSCMFGKDKTDHTEQAQQAWGGAQDRFGHILPRSFKTQMGAYFLKGRFDRPARCKPTGDLLKVEAGIGGIKVFVSVCALEIVNKDPANGNQSFAPFIPLACISGKFNLTVRAAVPTDGGRDQFSPGYKLLRLW